MSYGHPAGTPGATGVERLRPRENGQRVSGGAWEGTDGFVETPHGFPLDYRDSSAISTGVAVLWSAATTPVRASVQTGEPLTSPVRAIRSAARPRLGASPVRTTVSRPWSQVMACATRWRSARTLDLSAGIAWFGA